MGFIFSFIKRLFTLLLRVVLKVFIYFFIFASIIVLLPNLPPYTSFTKIDLEPTLPREGPLAPNNDLNNLEKLYTEKLVGPECFQLYNGQVYTTLATGEIVKLSPGNHVTFVAQIGKPCAGIKEEHICGRPLGFEIVEKKNLLYVADAYYGIWSVDLKTNKKTLLVSPHVEINGQLPKLFNSLALDSKGNLYYTDSNTDFQLNNGGFAVLTDPTGRLIRYNAAKNESKVLLDKLWLANGLAVSPNDEFIVVAESNAYRLMKYYLNGPKKGQKEVLIAGLPGAPDNLRALPDGSGLQAALYMSHGADEPMLGHSLAAAPLVRKFLVRTQYLLQLGFQFLNQQFPHVIFEDAIYNIGHFRSLSNLMTNSSALLHIDWNGNIKKAYFHTQGEIHISDALLYNDKVYLGAPHGQNFVAAVPAPHAFKKAFTPKDHPQVKKEVPPAQSAPKHTEQPKQAPTPTPIKIVPVEQKAEAPKTTQPPPKPTQQPPKPTQQPPKPAQQAQQPPKQAQQTQQPPKPAQQAQQPPKPTQQTQPPSKPAQEPPKPTQQPPKTAQQPPKPTPSPPKPAEQPAKQTPPPVQSTTQKPVQKKVDAPPSPTAKPKEQKPAPTKPVEQKQQKPDAAAPQQIPITEEIPSDTIKPSKETLKVIKKAGPTEIPNPEL